MNTGKLKNRGEAMTHKATFIDMQKGEPLYIKNDALNEEERQDIEDINEMLTTRFDSFICQISIFREADKT